MSFFFERLQNALKERGFSQCKLAKTLNVSQHTVWKWTHEQLPSLDRFYQICQALEITPNELLGVAEQRDYPNSQD